LRVFRGRVGGCGGAIGWTDEEEDAVGIVVLAEEGVGVEEGNDVEIGLFEASPCIAGLGIAL